MKNITNLTEIIICFLFTTTIIAQTRVNASDIMRDIKSGKNIEYNNVTIVGDLDFTFIG
jgi:hypothetical protein